MAVEEQLQRTVPAGTVLFREGEPGCEMFVVQSGRIQLARQGGGVEMVLAELVAGEFFGEMAVLSGHPRTATATALEESRLLVVSASRFANLIRERADVAARLIYKLSARLERANQQIDLLLLKDTDHRVVRELRRLAETSGMRDPGGAGARIEVSIAELAGRVGVDEITLRAILARLARAQLLTAVTSQSGAGTAFTAGFLIPEVGRLQEFLELLELQERNARGI